MVTLIVDDGAIEVYCTTMKQAVDYIDVLHGRGHKKIILMEKQDDKLESNQQVRENIQEPTERRKSKGTEGL